MRRPVILDVRGHAQRSHRPHLSATHTHIVGYQWIFTIARISTIPPAGLPANHFNPVGTHATSVGVRQAGKVPLTCGYVVINGS